MVSCRVRIGIFPAQIETNFTENLILELKLNLATKFGLIVLCYCFNPSPVTSIFLRVILFQLKHFENVL